MVIKNRTIMCSDEDREQIKSMAEEIGVSVSKFLVDEVNQNNDSENIKCILNCVKLLAYDRMDVLFEKLDEENARLYLDDTKGKYYGIE